MARTKKADSSIYPFSNEFRDKIVKELEILMKRDKIYKDAALSLSNLAQKLSTNTAYLSRIINDTYQVNFSTWVNRYRIAEAKSMLLVSYESIEKVGQMSGFGSKSVFNKAFKIYTGYTPSAWLKTQNPL